MLGDTIFSGNTHLPTILGDLSKKESLAAPIIGAMQNVEIILDK